MFIGEYDYDLDMKVKTEEAFEKGSQKKAVEGALILIKDFQVSPELTAEKMNAPLEKVLEAKWRTLRDDPQGRLKLFKFALTRGYEYEEIDPLVRTITSPK